MVLNSDVFEVAESLPADKLEETVAAGSGVAARAVLDAKGWKGEAIIVPCINMGTDNKTITGCKMVTKGKLNGVEFEAKKFWNGLTKPYKITIKEVDLDIFNYDENLVSQWMGEETWEVEYTVDDEEQSRDEFRADGGKPFSIRAQLKPTSEDACKVTLAMVPKSMMEISLLPAQGPGVPSFKVGAKEIPFFPTTTTPWGLKFQPLILKGSPTAALDKVCQWEMRRAIHTTLQGAVAMTFCRNIQSFDKKWRVVVDKKEVPTVPKADVWPEIAPRAATSAAGGGDTSQVVTDTGEKF